VAVIKFSCLTQPNACKHAPLNTLPADEGTCIPAKQQHDDQRSVETLPPHAQSDLQAGLSFISSDSVRQGVTA
jgi:hypothetical protein